MTGLVERLRTESLQQGMQQGRQEGRHEGRQQGRQEGRQEGEQTMLRKLLVRRFGPLDAVTEQRLQQATADELERWAENLLDARSLAEVFNQG